MIIECRAYQRLPKTRRLWAGDMVLRGASFKGSQIYRRIKSGDLCTVNGERVDYWVLVNSTTTEHIETVELERTG